MRYIVVINWIRSSRSLVLSVSDEDKATDLVCDIWDGMRAEKVLFLNEKDYITNYEMVILNCKEIAGVTMKKVQE